MSNEEEYIHPQYAQATAHREDTRKFPQQLSKSSFYHRSKSSKSNSNDEIAPSSIGVLKPPSVAPAPKRVRDLSQNPRKPSLLGVIKTSQRGRATSLERVSQTSKRRKETDARGDIFRLKATFGMKAVNIEVTERKNNSLHKNFAGSHQNILESLPRNNGYSTN